MRPWAEGKNRTQGQLHPSQLLTMETVLDPGATGGAAEAGSLLLGRCGAVRGGASCTEPKPEVKARLEPQTLLAWRVGVLARPVAYWTFSKREERGIQTMLELPQIASTSLEMKENEPKLLEPPLGPQENSWGRGRKISPS